MPTSSGRVSTFGTTVFMDINLLAQEYNALNLGQGKPDFDAQPDIIQQMVQAAQFDQCNQYAPSSGTASLRQAVAAHVSRWYNLDIDAGRGVVITTGALEGIFSSLLGLVDPGDEVIVFEPYYDSYVPNILMAGAVPVYVQLHPPTWTFDPDELRAAFTRKTRALMLNTPHNPMEFTRYITKEIGVACIPLESFYCPEHAHISSNYVRFAFCKRDEVLQEVHRRLEKLQ